MDTKAIFPEKIIVNILTRLPAKTLHRFKCVSKPWLSLITSPRFLKAYSTLSPPHPSSWILTNRDAQVIPPWDLFGPFEGQKITFSLTEPPNISHMTMLNFSLLWTHPKPPSIITSSNGIILQSTQTHQLVLINPVSVDRELLPYCCEISWVKRVGLAVKYTPTYDDVTVVVIEPQAPEDPSKEAATLLMFRSDAEKWEKKPALYKAGSKRVPNLWEADTCFEAGGRLFWVKLSCGMLVLDDPFGERLELRFIPLPEGFELPQDTPKLHESRMVYPAGGFVLFGSLEEVWRLTDVEKGEWGLFFKVSDEYLSGLPEGLGVLELSAVHPLEPEVVVMTSQNSSFLVNVKEAKVVDTATCQRRDEDGNECSYYPVVLPPWPTPMPKRLCASSSKLGGNCHFQLKNFEGAVDFYSRSISYFPTAAAYANRAACYLNLGKYQEAENDCSEALKLDDQYLKVYVRRATARKVLGKLLEAKEDICMALKVDGGQNRELLKLSSEINRALEKMKLV